MRKPLPKLTHTPEVLAAILQEHRAEPLRLAQSLQSLGWTLADAAWAAVNWSPEHLAEAIASEKQRRRIALHTPNASPKVRKTTRIIRDKKPTKAVTRKAPGRKATAPSTGVGARLKSIRQHAGFSQEAVGAQGFVSTPGWIKLENGQRSPSEKLLAALVNWLIQEKIIRAGQRAALIEELTALKYAGHRSAFLATMARDRLATLTPVAL